MNKLLNSKNVNDEAILVYGGARFVSSLLAGGHIDELYLFLNPVLINNGLDISGGISEKHSLQLESAIPYLGGITVLHHKWK